MTRKEYDKTLEHVSEQFDSLGQSTEKCLSSLIIVGYAVIFFSLFFSGIL